MIADRREGVVIVALLTISTIVMLTIVGVCCMIGGRQYKLNAEQEVRAEVLMLEDGALEEGHEAMLLRTLV